MRKKLVSGLSILLVFFISCKETPEDKQLSIDIKKQQDQKIKKADLEKIEYIEYILDLKTDDVIKDWQEYYQIQEAVTKLKEANLKFFDDTEQLLKTNFKNLKASMPSSINSQSVLARVLVLETKLLKLHSLYNLTTTTKQELVVVIKEVLVAFSNLNFQMNKKVEFDSRVIEKP